MDRKRGTRGHLGLLDRKRGVQGKDWFGETDAASGLDPFKHSVKMGHPGGSVRRTAGETEGAAKGAIRASLLCCLSPGLSRLHTGAVSHAPLCTHHLSQ